MLKSFKLDLFQKVYKILNSNQKKKALVVLIFLFIVMFLETIGTGMIMPVLSYITNPESLNEYPIFNKVFVALNLNSKNQIIFFLLILLIIPNLIKFFCLGLLSYLQSKFTYDFQSLLSKRIFNTYLSQPYSFHLNRNSSTLLQVVTAEVNTLTSMTNQIMTLLTDLSMLISILFLLLYVEPIGAISAFLIFGTFGYLFYFISKKYLSEWGKKRQKHETLTIKHLQQGLGGIKDIKILGKEFYFANKFGLHRDKTSDVNQKQMFISQLPRVWLELLTILTITIMITFTIFAENGFNSFLPIIGLFVAAAFKIIPSINRIISSFQIFIFSIPAINIVFNELKLESEILIKSDTIDSYKNFSKINLVNVNFSYEKNKSNILNNINLTINKGDIVGLVGFSGEGKSTLIDTILGLLKPDKGNIYIDGMDIHNNLRFWQNKIGYVPQNIFLTDDTLKRNIAFGVNDEDIDEGKINKAIISAQLEKLVDNSVNKLETLVGERGVKLSGGQRQRIGIARALYNDPEIIVLDEATSSLDTDTEVEVMKSIHLLSKTKTIIIATHRLSTVEKVDRLFKVNKGELILINKSDIYSI